MVAKCNFRMLSRLLLRTVAKGVFISPQAFSQRNNPSTFYRFQHQPIQTDYAECLIYQTAYRSVLPIHSPRDVSNSPLGRHGDPSSLGDSPNTTRVHA